MRNDKPQPIYKIELENTLVTSFQDSGDNGGDRPMESLSFNYAKIHYTVYIYEADGSVKPITTNSSDGRALTLTQSPERPE